MADSSQRRPSNPGLHGRYLLSPDVVLMPLADGTAQLVDLDGSFYGLSETAAQMLKATLDMGEHDAFQRIAAQYNADLDRVRTDLAELIETLRAKGLIRRSGDRLRTVAGLRTAMALAISYPVFKIVTPVRNQRLKAMMLLAVARLCFALFGWARTVNAWHKFLRRPHVSAADLEQQPLIAAIDDAIRLSANNLPSISCKERALCCWFMLRSAGVKAKLLMGVRFLPFSAHCWCEVDERILTDSAESCKAYTPIICYEE
jgi:Transglutaminase-like superfamily/Coenzyme PQQ synthesis protein D (PqqD)